jgi:hypothetical protein
MSPSASASIPAPGKKLEATFDAFWKIVEEQAAGMEIHPGSRQMLEKIIRAGLANMRQENRLKESDILEARESLATFIGELKERVNESAHPEAFGEDTTDAAIIHFQTMHVTLWPFIPPPWSRR